MSQLVDDREDRDAELLASLEAKLRVTAPVVGLQAAKNALEVEVAARIASLPTGERLAVWKAQTGKSRAEMYRALARVGPTTPSQLSQPSPPSHEAAGNLEMGG